MLKLFLILFVLFVSSISTCNSNSEISPYQRGMKNSSPKQFTVEKVEIIKQKKVWITAYWSYPKQDRWTSKRQSSTGVYLKGGIHIAVDPNEIPYGSEIQLPDGSIRKAVDTGSAVKRKLASKGKYVIIDVYFYSKSEAIVWLNKYSGIQEVRVL